MTFHRLPASRHGIRLACVRCKAMTPAEKLLADRDGRAFMDYYCWLCAPQLKGCCSLPAHVFAEASAVQLSLSLSLGEVRTI